MGHHLVLAATLLFAALAGSAWAEVCPKRGGIIRTVDMNLPAVDPAISVDPESYTRLVYDSLIDVLPDLTYRPGLASELPEQVDPKTYVFHLRDGVTFHDGTKFDAEAVKFNVDRLVSGKVISPFTGIWRELLEQVVVVDPLTVRFELKKPWPDFDWTVASTLFFGSPTLINQLGREYGVKGAAGTGPFVFKSFTPFQRIELTRNPNYYRTGEPCVDGLQGAFYASGSLRLLALLKGDLTNVYTFPESDLKLLEGRPEAVVQEAEATTLTMMVVNTRNPALRDVRVRQAIQHGINGQEIIDKVYGGRGKLVESLFPPWHPAFVKAGDLSPLQHDPARAKALLAEAGYGPDRPLKINLQCYNAPAHVDRAVLMQAQLKPLGIEITVTQLPSGQAQANLAAGRYELSLTQIDGGPTIRDYSWDLLASTSGRNAAYFNKPDGFQDKEAEALVQRLGTAADPVAARADIQALQERIFRDLPYIYVNQRNARDAWRSEEKGFVQSKLKNHQDFRTVWFDR